MIAFALWAFQVTAQLMARIVKTGTSNTKLKKTPAEKNIVWLIVVLTYHNNSEALLLCRKDMDHQSLQSYRSVSLF